ncbi:hypothetical protein [Phyllobacterium sophorae]|nr:hypothetical protein [Phyllobacterium sophorae]
MFRRKVPMYSIVAKKPSDCSARELEQFVKLVMAGGEVANGLPARVQKEVSLVMLFNDEELVGTTGLKRPETDYQNKVFRRNQTKRGANSGQGLFNQHFATGFKV